MTSAATIPCNCGHKGCTALIPIGLFEGNEPTRRARETRSFRHNRHSVLAAVRKLGRAASMRAGRA